MAQQTTPVMSRLWALPVIDPGYLSAAISPHKLSHRIREIGSNKSASGVHFKTLNRSDFNFLQYTHWDIQSGSWSALSAVPFHDILLRVQLRNYDITIHMTTKPLRPKKCWRVVTTRYDSSQRWRLDTTRKDITTHMMTKPLGPSICWRLVMTRNDLTQCWRFVTNHVGIKSSRLTCWHWAIGARKCWRPVTTRNSTKSTTNTLHMIIPRSLIHEQKQACYSWIYLVL